MRLKKFIRMNYMKMIELNYVPVGSGDKYHVFVNVFDGSYALLYIDKRTIYPRKFDRVEDLIDELYTLPVPGLADKIIKKLGDMGAM